MCTHGLVQLSVTQCHVIRETSCQSAHSVAISAGDAGICVLLRNCQIELRVVCDLHDWAVAWNLDNFGVKPGPLLEITRQAASRYHVDSKRF